VKSCARVVDLFAGPGGLGEGFSALRDSSGNIRFHIEMSVEKEASAHKTLELRAFFRSFDGQVPEAYYDYLRGTITREDLFSRYEENSTRAITETLGAPTCLGDETDDLRIAKRVRQIRKKDGPWVVIGGPPCQAYSLVGRARNAGVEGYTAEDDHRHFLYKEYLKMLWQVKPEIFVMENVKGILSSRIDGELIFPSILDDLRHPGRALGYKTGRGYKIWSLVENAGSGDLFGRADTEYAIKCEKYGVPQARHRVILIGVRDDIRRVPGQLEPVDKPVTVGSVLSDLPKLRSGLSKGGDSFEKWQESVEDAANTVRKELQSRGLDAEVLNDILARSKRLRSRGARALRSRTKFKGPEHLATWLLDDRLEEVINHETRGHIESDLARYLYCSVYASQRDGASPRSFDFPESLAPNHANWASGKFVDRFKVQSRLNPASTITSHISKDGHYYIHYDPAQCRSLTVREAARLQTFPDNYFFEGNRTQQYVQVGNAVPPYLANQIAKIVDELLYE
jgi:DNA (cytosine-5)-methyltransferase 1